MFGFMSKPINDLSPYYIVVIFAMLIFIILEHIFKFYNVNEKGEIVLNNRRITIIILCLLLFLALNFSGEPLPFIYFEF